MRSTASAWSTMSGLLPSVPWLPLLVLTTRGIVTCCPLTRVAVHSEVVPTFVSTPLGQSIDFVCGRSGSCSSMNRCVFEISSDFLTSLPPVENDTEHPLAARATSEQTASTARKVEEANRFMLGGGEVCNPPGDVAPD